MGDWISFLPYLVGAQALGVSLAWGADMVSSIWRESEAAVFLFSFIELSIVLFLLVMAPAGFRLPLLLTLFWLIIVTWVQKRQRKSPLWNAFFGALMQAFCFGCTLIFAVLLLSSVVAVHWKWGTEFFLVFILSAVLTYALLSLFRPTIYGAWNTWRQNGKNRRVR